MLIMEEKIASSLSICEGCLSSDRRISKVYNTNIITIYIQLLGSAKNPSSLALCWECAAIIRKVLKFREQVKNAHRYLEQFMLDKSHQFKPLTKLSINAQNHIQNAEFISNFELKVGTNEDNNIEDGMTEWCGADVKSANKSLTSRKSSKKTQTASSEENVYEYLPNIKVETIHVENDIVLDDGLSEWSGDVNVELENENNSVPSPEFKNYEDEFDESDDEPLCIKKQKNKENSKKKNAEDKKKHRSRRKEKPPGVIKNERVRKKLKELNVAEDELEMLLLSWEEVELERQKHRQSAAYQRHRYKCEDCVLGFNHKFKLENHMKKHEEVVGSLRCDVCRVVCKDGHALSAHRRRHRLRWRCSSCGQVYSRPSVAADHLARKHPPAAARPHTHVCHVCGHVHTTLGKLRSHMKSHAERQECELCGKTFRDRTSLKTHLFIHQGEKEYACARCGKSFLFKKAMELHQLTHDPSALLYCNKCDMNFKNKMSYYQHMKYNLKHVDPDKLKYSCSWCSKRFVKEARLREHIAAVHLRQRPLSCQTAGCHFSCSSGAVLRTHVRMVHRNQRAVRNYVCHSCGKTYKTRKCLEGHLSTHTGVRPYQCAVCDATFAYRAALYNHNRLVHNNGQKCRRKPSQKQNMADTDSWQAPAQIEPEVTVGNIT